MHDATGLQAFRPAAAPVDVDSSIGSGMRVLVADDVRDTVMTLGILLRSEGFDVRLASNGLDAFNAVREFRPEVVLLDLGMADLNGYAIAHQLTRDLGSKCPVLIAVIGHDAHIDKHLAEISGFNHYVANEPDELLGLLASLKL